MSKHIFISGFLPAVILFVIATGFSLHAQNSTEGLELYNEAVDEYQRENFNEAVNLWERSASKGYGPANTILGKLYLSDDVVTQDYDKAVRWLREGAEAGDAEAQYYLGYLYYSGTGVKKSIYDAVKWYRKATEQNHKEAGLNLGILYYNGEEIEKDTKEAAIIFRKSIEKKYDVDENPYFILGDHNYSKGRYDMAATFFYYIAVEEDSDFEQVISDLQEAGQEGNLMAYWALGKAYKEGNGIDKNKDEAIKWYKLAADKGHLESQKDLGLVYGGQKPHKEGFRYFLMAAKQGDPFSQVVVADYYAYGHAGIEKNLQQAKYWYEKAITNDEYAYGNPIEGLLSVDKQLYPLNHTGWSYFAKDTEGNSYYYNPQSILRYDFDDQKEVKVLYYIDHEYTQKKDDIAFDKQVFGMIIDCTDLEYEIKMERLLNNGYETFFKVYKQKPFVDSVFDIEAGTIVEALKKKVCH